jgi:hypothetical protein
MAQPQTFKNHTRWDPIFHFFVGPMLLLNFAFAIYATIHRWNDARPYHHTHIWWIILSVVFFFMAAKTRDYSLKNQDRIIRLEEQLRLADLIDEDHLDLIDKITIKQFVALRFASDAELPSLAARAVAENLDPKQIKQAIVTWRPDNDRV